jgi:hypothetical protein
LLELIQSFDASSGGKDMRASLAKLDGQCATDPAGCAGHNDSGIV